MLYQRCTRWTNIKPTLGECVTIGSFDLENSLGQFLEIFAWVFLELIVGTYIYNNK